VGAITIAGLTSGWAVPGVYLEIDFAAGLNSEGEGELPVLIIDNMLSTGSATADTVVYGPDTPVPCSSEADVIGLFGSGSNVHRAWRRFTAVNTTTPVYMIGESEGGSAVAATLAITLSGTATASGAVRFHLGGDYVDVGFAVGDTAATIAGNALAILQAKTVWAATPGVSGAIVTWTSKNKGLRANQLRGWAQIIPGANTGITSNKAAPTLFTSGSVQDDNTTALATMEGNGRRFYYVISGANDATNLGRVSAAIDAQAQPLVGLRQRFFWGTADTLANTITIAIGVNDPRGDGAIWQMDSDWTGVEIAADAVAQYCLGEAQPTPLLNFNGSSSGQLRAPDKGTAPTPTQQNSALSNGITPIAVARNGQGYIVKRITSHSLAGSNQDFRIRDAGKVTVCDFFSDQLQAELASAIAGKNIGDDAVGNAPSPPANVFTPRQARSITTAVLSGFNDQGLLQNFGTILANMSVVRDPNAPNRMLIQVPLYTADTMDQVGVDVQQVG
jgi:phage tail sheath gpL-like